MKEQILNIKTALEDKTFRTEELYKELELNIATLEKTLSGNTDSTDVYRCQRDILKLMTEYHEFATYIVLNAMRFSILRNCALDYMLSTLEYFPNTSKLPHRTIIANMYFTEVYLNKELTCLNMIDDYYQIQSVINAATGFKYDVPDDINVYTYLTPEELRQLSDSWACMLLDSRTIELRSTLSNDMSDHVKTVSKFVKDTIMKGMVKELVCRKADIVFNTISDKYKFISEDSMDDRCLIHNIMCFTASYLVFTALKRYIKDLSKTFDSYDYLLFIHVVFQINRWNYNND